jgi:hypothetical protein
MRRPWPTGVVAPKSNNYTIENNIHQKPNQQRIMPNLIP